jgi:DNA repair protein RadC
MAEKQKTRTHCPTPTSLLNPSNETMPDEDLLAILLTPARAAIPAQDTARELINQFGSIRGVLCASYTDLTAIHGIGHHRASLLLCLREFSCRYLQEQLAPGKLIQSPADSQEYLMARFRDRPQEIFCALFLDNRHRVIALEELFFGTIDATVVYPREILRRALQRNAAAVILAHNHPSGVPEPSAADQSITRRVREALEFIDVRLLDHFVIGDSCCVSLAARGMI